MSRRSLRRGVASRIKSRRLLLESLEPRQMLTSIPVALDDPLYNTAVNTDLVVSTVATGVANNDFDADGNSLSASVVANPASGSLVSFNSNGTFTYRPNTSFTGIDTFTYKVSDGSLDSNVAALLYLAWDQRICRSVSPSAGPGDRPSTGSTSSPTNIIGCGKASQPPNDCLSPRRKARHACLSHAERFRDPTGGFFNFSTISALVPV